MIHNNQTLSVSKNITQALNRPTTCKLNENLQNECKENIPQSPKIKNNVYRSNSKPKLFSLIDIQDRYHSKTTSVPNQYKRKIYNNIDKLLYSKNKDIFKIPQIEYNKDKQEKNEKPLRRNKSQEDINSKDYRIQSALISRKERLYKPICWENYGINDIKKKQRDKLMPEGYEFYEKNIMDFNKTYFKNNYAKIDNIKNKRNKNATVYNDHMLIRKINKFKQYQSDIFFLKEKERETKNEENKNENNIRNKFVSEKAKNLLKYTDSDIFNLRKQDKTTIEKSGEYSYFRKLDPNKTNDKALYNINSETLLGWKLRAPLPSLYNYTSTKFHLLNRDIKNIGKTKEIVANECKNMNTNFNPIHKQKSLCEFIDLSRVSAPNINNDYNKALNDNPNIFKKQNDISSEYFDIYNKYNSICDKPFQKFNPIKGI